ISPNIVYTGAAPNQQITPAVKWAMDNIGKRIFIIGSDYVFPRTASAIIQDMTKNMGGEVVGDEYLLLGSQHVDGIIAKIKEAKPDVIMNNINGDSNLAFFKALADAGLTADKLPVFSFSIAEDELRHMKADQFVGTYTAWNYFQSIDNPTNKEFVARYKERYGNHRVTDDPIEAGYMGVFLWAQAAEAAKSAEPEKIKSFLGEQSLQAPEGLVYIDAETQHTWKSVRIGKFNKDGQVDIVWDSERPIKPIPYPTTRSKEEWDNFLQDMYEGWNGNWANLGTNN
ncbi:MAG: transporter substrate-binding protein, partial [Bacteroidota bacterium]